MGEIYLEISLKLLLNLRRLEFASSMKRVWKEAKPSSLSTLDVNKRFAISSLLQASNNDYLFYLDHESWWRILAEFVVVPSAVNRKITLLKRNSLHQRDTVPLWYLYSLCKHICRYLKLLQDQNLEKVLDINGW